MPTAIEFNNISKLYRLGLVSTGTLAHDLKRWWTVNIRGKEDPYLTIGETNDRSTKGESDYVWALKDIDFKVEQGDVVGIIGKNGAGKSTLLKILSKVTAPTTGTIRARGRIGSLLEVGTGFHPEMTGRENIYMNGAILGMTKAEISKKLDEIVDFSGCERYIDTPVKRYSSGMMVRLGFAVAAHLDPEILVVDEVLAVGDAEFQKKAIGKMQDVSRGEGRTVLFVSHNMASIRQLCTSCVLLKNGLICKIGDTTSIIDLYTTENTHYIADNLEDAKRRGSGIVKFHKVYITNKNGQTIDHVLTGQNIILNFVLQAQEDTKIDLGFSFFTPEDTMVSNLYSSFEGVLFNVKRGYTTITCKINDFPFSSPTLLIRGVINIGNSLSDWPNKHLAIFQVERGDYYKTGKLSTNNIPFLFKGEWQQK